MTNSTQTSIHSTAQDPFYFIDRAKDLFVETSLLRHGFSEQEIKKTAWENLPRLGGMIASVTAGIFFRRSSWGMAAQLLAPLATGTTFGTLAQMMGKYEQYWWDKANGREAKEIGFGDLLQSANDAFDASMSITIGGGVTLGLGKLAVKTGLKIFASRILRGVVVSEAIGAAHAVKNRDATYRLEDVIISGATGALGGWWAPYMEKRWAQELFFEINREFGENILQTKFDRFSDGDLTIENVTGSFVLSFAELGGSIKGQRGGNGTGCFLKCHARSCSFLPSL